MENGFAVLMLIFGTVVMIYAAILSGGNEKLLPIRVQPSLRRKDKKGQTKQIAKVLAVTALTPLIGGLLGLWRGNIACLIGMGCTAVVSVIAAILMKRRKPNE